MTDLGTLAAKLHGRPAERVETGSRPVSHDDRRLWAVGAELTRAIRISFRGVPQSDDRPVAVRVGTLATVAAALTLIPLLESVLAVVVANAALWLVVASVAPVLTMLVVADAPERVWGERLGLLNKYQGYGWAGGLVLGTVWPLVATPVFGSAVARLLFPVLAACAATSAVWIARSLPRPDPGRRVTSDRQLRRVARLLATTRTLRPRRLVDRAGPVLVTYLLATALVFAGSAAFYAPLPIFLAEADVSTEGIFGLYLVAALASAVLYGPIGRLATRYDLRLLQSGALATRGAVIPGLALIAGLGPLTIAAGGVGLAVVGGTWAVIAVVGTAITTRLAPPSIRGDVLGAYAAAGAVAGGVGGIGGGWAASFGYAVAFGVAGGLVVLGAALVFSLRVVSTGGRNF
ncbi:MAG: MFS transporter [Salinirussus sp.]